MQRWSVNSTLKSIKQWFIDQITQKVVAGISQTSRLDISTFSTPTRYSKDILPVRKGSISEGGELGSWKWAPDWCWAAVIPQFHQYWYTNSTDNWINPHHLLPLKILYPVGQYFSHQNVGLLTSHVSKILRDLADIVRILSQLHNFLSSLSQGSVPKTYQRWAVNSWNVDRWRSHSQFVTKKTADRGDYIKENHHHSTNLDVPVFMFALEIAKGDNCWWCEKRHRPYIWTGFVLSYQPRSSLRPVLWSCINHMSGSTTIS